MTVKQARINWSQEEAEQVARRYLALIQEDQDLGEGAALMQAQQVLPENRRRHTLSGFSQAPRVLKILGGWGQSPNGKATKTVGKPRETVPPPLNFDAILKDVPVDRLVATLASRDPGKLAKVSPSQEELVKDLPDDLLITELVQRQPELFPEGSPTSHLLNLVIDRFLVSLTQERLAMTRTVTEQVLAHLSADRARFEQRLFNIESKITIPQKDKLPVAPIPEGGRSAYMPMIVVAGCERADFQRLQAQLMNASVRLQKLDVSRPNQISMPQYDRMVIWQKGLTESLVSVIRSRCTPAKVVLYPGDFVGLAPLISDIARVVRAEVK